MRRRTRDPDAADFPPQLAEFNIGDWWVDDPEDPCQAGYARIQWRVARRAYLEGGDWRSYLEPPAWYSQPGA